MTTGAILLFAQAAATPAAPPARPPDVELAARIAAREVTIEQEGPIRLELHAEPGVTDVAIERSQPAGARSYRNLVIDARVAAWLGENAQPAAAITEPIGEQPQ